MVQGTLTFEIDPKNNYLTIGNVSKPIHYWPEEIRELIVKELQATIYSCATEVSREEEDI